MLLLQNAMCCFSVCFFKARLLRMIGGAVGFSATAFIERRRPSVQERCVRKESVGRIGFGHMFWEQCGKGWLGIFASLQKEKAEERRKSFHGVGGWSRPVSCYSYQTSTGVRGSVLPADASSVSVRFPARVLCHTKHELNERENTISAFKKSTEEQRKVEKTK